MMMPRTAATTTTTSESKPSFVCLEGEENSRSKARSKKVFVIDNKVVVPHNENYYHYYYYYYRGQAEAKAKARTTSAAAENLFRLNEFSTKS